MKHKLNLLCRYISNLEVHKDDIDRSYRIAVRKKLKEAKELREEILNQCNGVIL